MQTDILDRLDACERDNRRLTRLLRWQFAASILLIGTLVAGCVATARSNASASTVPARLRASELVIVDPKGIERVRISGDLPDAVINGKRIPRGEKAAGVILYDATGQERSGYLTWDPSGNVGLTLDSRKGQVTLFVADPDSGSALQLWQGHDLIELRSDEEGSRLTAVRGDQVVFQEPAVTMGNEACTAYRDAKSRLPAKQVFRECARRYTQTACRVCLGD